ncbi:VC0807 family protein [Rossellomorea oryzaecorticis]|uniref:VC0807 family protein n=1 Tax=Rossellomorea oryzaecorticis TaxID=1396505 RepID=A0ABU9K778_9BACI
MQKKIVLGDVIFYLIFPIVIWNLGRDYIGDYYAMLLSSVPGIIYSVIRFILLKKVNLLGLFMIGTLLAGTLIDVLSGSALNLLWNKVYYSYFMSSLFVLTILINRPIALFFALDFVEMQGYDRMAMKDIFYQKRILNLFKLITFGFVFRDILLASIKVWLIVTYGVEAFDKGLILRQVLNWTLSGLTIYGFIYISKILNEDRSPGRQADLKD